LNRNSTASWKARGLGFGLLAGVCALNAAPAWAEGGSSAEPDYTALVLGHAFLAQPNATYMQELIGTYVNPTTPFAGQPTYNVVGDPVSVYTPETNYTTGLPISATISRCSLAHSDSWPKSVTKSVED